MNFAERLKLLRKEKKMSQRILAGLLGISNSALAMYETGARQPDYTTLQKIANYFEESIDYLLGNSNMRNHHATLPEKTVDKEQNKIKEQLVELIPHADTDERKKQLLEIIDLPPTQFSLIHTLAKSPVLEDDRDFIKYYNLLSAEDKEKVKSVIKLFIEKPEQP